MSGSHPSAPGCRRIENGRTSREFRRYVAAFVSMPLVSIPVCTVTSCHAAGLPVTMHAVRADQSRRWLAMGFDELVLTADIELLRSAFATRVAQVRFD
jgi:hypothetical protein